MRLLVAVLRIGIHSARYSHLVMRVTLTVMFVSSVPFIAEAKFKSVDDVECEGHVPC